MRKLCLIFIFSFLICFHVSAQLKWQNVDSLYQPLPPSVHVYFTNEAIDTGPFRAYYFIADLKDRKLDFTVDTAHDRRLTPATFFERNNKPLLVVNCTFFSYETNRSLNVVIKDGKLVAFNPVTVDRIQTDSSIKKYAVMRGAIGISKDRAPDIAWLFTDSSKPFPLARQYPFKPT